MQRCRSQVLSLYIGNGAREDVHHCKCTRRSSSRRGHRVGHHPSLSNGNFHPRTIGLEAEHHALSRASYLANELFAFSKFFPIERTMAMDMYRRKLVLSHGARMRVCLPRGTSGAQVQESKVCVVGCCSQHGLGAGQSAIPMLDHVKKRQLDALNRFASTVLFTLFKIRNSFQVARVSCRNQ